MANPFAEAFHTIAGWPLPAKIALGAGTGGVAVLGLMKLKQGGSSPSVGANGQILGNGSLSVADLLKQLGYDASTSVSQASGGNVGGSSGGTSGPSGPSGPIIPPAQPQPPSNPITPNPPNQPVPPAQPNGPQRPIQPAGPSGPVTPGGGRLSFANLPVLGGPQATSFHPLLGIIQPPASPGNQGTAQGSSNPGGLTWSWQTTQGISRSGGQTVGGNAAGGVNVRAQPVAAPQVGRFAPQQPGPARTTRYATLRRG